MTVITSASESWVSAFEQRGGGQMPFVDGGLIPVGGKNAPCLAVVTLCCEPNVAGAFGRAAERCLKIRNVRVVPRNLVDACAHTANTTVGQVPDDKGGVANLGGISLANLLRCQRVSTGRRVVVDARADAGWGTDEPIELSSVQFHSAT